MQCRSFSSPSLVSFRFSARFRHKPSKNQIDIEIDGIHYHTDEDGNRKMDDNLRDLQVEGAGWLVKRFWVYELRDNMPECVREIKRLLT